MKKFYIFFLIVLPAISMQAQVNVSAVMGLNFMTSPSFKDYINANFAPVNDQMQSFKSSVEFAAEADYAFSQNFELGIEYGLQLDSYTTSSGRSGYFEATYSHHKPSVIAYYVIPGVGYRFKFGGGAGLRILSLDQQIANSPQKVNYSATGFGVILKAQALTLLSGDFYANIGADIRYDFPGEPEDGSGRKIVDASVNENVNMNMLSVGLKLGVSYFF